MSRTEVNDSWYTEVSALPVRCWYFTEVTKMT